MKIYKILFKHNETNEFIKTFNTDFNKYKNNLKILREAEKKNKCEIIFNGITTNKEDLNEYYKYL